MFLVLLVNCENFLETLMYVNENLNGVWNVFIRSNKMTRKFNFFTNAMTHIISFILLISDY